MDAAELVCFFKYDGMLLEVAQRRMKLFATKFCRISSVTTPASIAARRPAVKLRKPKGSKTSCHTTC
jgi:hypothetical protein